MVVARVGVVVMLIVSVVVMPFVGVMVVLVVSVVLVVFVSVVIVVFVSVVVMLVVGAVVVALVGVVIVRIVGVMVVTLMSFVVVALVTWFAHDSGTSPKSSPIHSEPLQELYRPYGRLVLMFTESVLANWPAEMSHSTYGECDFDSKGTDKTSGSERFAR